MKKIESVSAWNIAVAALHPSKQIMKTPLGSVVRFLVFVAVLLACSFDVEEAMAQPAATRAPASAGVSTNAKVRFRPATSGTASVRVTGGSRGTGDAAVTLDVLAPDDVGLTTQEQPSLFWFQSRPADAQFELTLLQPKKVKPLIQLKVERASKAGIQRLKLSEHGVKLNPGVEYQWVVALVTDPDNRSTDLVASGVIKRVEPDAGFKGRISHAAPASLPNLYAEAGIWYDALAALSDQIEAQPGDKTLRETRAELLRQVGLNAAAQADVSK
jgi:hypothetical protein